MDGRNAVFQERMDLGSIVVVRVVESGARKAKRVDCDEKKVEAYGGEERHFVQLGSSLDDNRAMAEKWLGDEEL